MATTLTFTVGPDDTAQALGSGDLPVLATPRLLAWCEAATIAGDPGVSSVGSRVRLDHLAPTPVGGEVTVTAEVEHEDGRLRRYAVSAADRSGRLVGTAEITRVTVDPDRFLARLPPP